MAFSVISKPVQLPNVAGNVPFIAAGTGVSARTVQSKLQETVSLTDFAGADPTGVISSHVAFNSAFKSNRTLIIPPGTWLVGANIGASNLTDFSMVLESGAVIKQASTLASKMMLFQNCSRIRITSRGMGRIDISSAPNSAAGQANDAIYFAGASGCNDVEVDHIHFFAGTEYLSGGGDSHIFFAGINGNFHHNRHEGAFDIAVYISGFGGGSTACHTAKVMDNQFVNCGGSCGVKRLFRGVIYEGNDHTGGLNGFFTGEADTSNLPGKHNIISGNRFEGLTGVCVASRMSDHDIISGNSFINCQSVSMVALQGATRALVRGNTFYVDPAVYVSPTEQRAIHLESRTFNAVTYYSTYNIVSDNVIDGIYTAIREEDALQDYNKYINNDLRNVTTAGRFLSTHSLLSDTATRRMFGAVSGFAGSQMVETQYAVRLVGASEQSIWNLNMPSTRACRIELEAICTISGGAAMAKKIIGTFRRQAGGNIVQVGTQEVVSYVNDTTAGAGGATDINFNADAGLNVIQAVAIRPGGTSDWMLNIRYTMVSTGTA